MRKISAEGHAGREISGRNIQCAASTVLLRTAYRTVTAQKIPSVISAENEGRLYFEIKMYRDDQIKWLRGVSDYLVTGLFDLAQEFPDSVRVVQDRILN